MPGGDRRDVGKCLHAINNAVACSLKPTVLCSPLPRKIKMVYELSCMFIYRKNDYPKFLPLVQITKCRVDLCLKLRSNSCWVFVGEAPAIKRAVASYKNTLAVANYTFYNLISF